ncbi:MAG TPA: hypothetical protein VGA09_09455 [Candidatus Binatia bacterium]
MEQPFARVVDRLQKLLEAASVELQIRIRIALIGGLAVSAWGAIRATQDVDLLADSDPSPIASRSVCDDLQRFFEKKHCSVEWRAGDPDDPIPLLLRLNLGGALSQPGADILWPTNGGIKKLFNDEWRLSRADSVCSFFIRKI